MSTVPDDRQHPEDPAEGPDDADRRTDTDGEPREHPQDPAEGPRD